MTKSQVLTAELLDSLAGMQATWDRLALECATSHPQYLYEWVAPWWRVLGMLRNDLYCLRVRDGAETVALAPLMLVRRRAHGVVALREIRWLACGSIDQGDIMASGEPGAVGVAIADHLIHHRADWDEVHLECVPEGSVAVQAMLETLRAGLSCAVSVKKSPSYYIDTTGDWDTYLATTSKKFVQRDLPRVRRRLADLGEVVIRRDREIDVADVLRIATPVHQARQVELSRISGFADEAYASFLADALEGLQALGMLSVWTLQVGEDVAGYLIGFETAGVFYAWNMAHNPKYNAASPGKSLWASVIQWCFENEGVREFNMMRGDTDYKLKWTDTSRGLLNIRVKNLGTARSMLLNRLRRAAG